MWSWKRDLTLSDSVEEAWTVFPKEEQAAIKTKLNNGETRFAINDTYSVDLEQMIQYRTDDQNRQRAIKLIKSKKKGNEEKESRLVPGGAAWRSPRKGKGKRLPTLDEQMKRKSGRFETELAPPVDGESESYDGEDSGRGGGGEGFRAVMLAHKWANPSEGEAKKGTKGVSVDPKGWFMSEKLDGLRAYYDGQRFYSRNGMRFYAPSWFTSKLPNIPLDGELWCGRGRFQEAVSICRKHVADEGWKKVKFMVFDAPGVKGPFETRLKAMNAAVEKAGFENLITVPFLKCKGTQHLNKSLEIIERKGGEGLMLRQPKSKYERCRSKTLLKVKTFFDEEARVVGKNKGTGKNAFVMGALVCELPNGTSMKVGSGFTDAQRRSPPKIGSVITFKFQETTRDGKPRFPTFLRERKDVTWEEVKAEYKKKKDSGADPYVSGGARKQAPLGDRQHSILWQASLLVGKKKDMGATTRGEKMTLESKSKKMEIEAETLMMTKDVIHISPKGPLKMKNKKRKRDYDDSGEMKASSQATEEIITQKKHASWTCTSCTFYNPHINRFCGMCGQKRLLSVTMITTKMMN